MNKKQYTIVFLLNKDKTKVLLQLKNKTTFKGMLNGVGGKVELHETPEDGAYREILEETSIKREDIQDFKWLGTLILPYNCDDKNADKLPELWFYSGIICDESLAHKPETESEPIDWYEINGANIDTKDIKLAGDGNIPYFINLALKH